MSNVVGLVTDLAVLAPAAVAWLAFAAGRASSERNGDTAASLERDLMRRRRRDEQAALLVVEGRCDDSAARSVTSALRLTDTVDAKSRRGRVRLRALLDEDGLERTAVERRLAQAGAGGELQLGWATFPEDGVSISVLEEVARGRLAPIEQEATPVLVVNRTDEPLAAWRPRFLPRETAVEKVAS